MTHPFAHLIGGGITRPAAKRTAEAKATPKVRDFSHLNKAARPMPVAPDMRPAGHTSPAPLPADVEAKRLAAEMIAAAKRCVR